MEKYFNYYLSHSAEEHGSAPWDDVESFESVGEELVQKSGTGRRFYGLLQCSRPLTSEELLKYWLFPDYVKPVEKIYRGYLIQKEYPGCYRITRESTGIVDGFESSITEAEKYIDCWNMIPFADDPEDEK